MKKTLLPWTWVPTLYFAQGIPYVVAATTFAVIMYKNMGISNSDIALYTSWLYLPWVIKPIWSPFVDMLKTKRWWIIVMQFLVGVSFAGIAFCIPTTFFWQSTLAFLWLTAFSSATHDIAADGFYILALDKKEQAAFVGIRSTFYRIAMIAGQGGFVMLAGTLEKKFANVAMAWSVTFVCIAVIFTLIAVYHLFVLPRSAEDTQRQTKNVFLDFGTTFVDFFSKKDVLISLLFILLYRFGEAQLVKIASPFLLDSRKIGGLGLSTYDVGLAYGTVGVVALTLGGILGGLAVARSGLRSWMMPMTLAMNLPNLVYVYLAYAQPENIYLIQGGIAVEQFGYGFGFTAFMLYLIQFSQGRYATAHYAICTGFMALGMMLPGMFAGYLQEWLGYEMFFIWVCICTLPGFVLLKFLPIK